MLKKDHGKWMLLKQYLEKLPTGEIENPQELESVFWELVDVLIGGEAAINIIKLTQRPEKIMWAPPVLQFDIERHGGMKMGSSRAEIQRWTLDVHAEKVCHENVGYRQLEKRLSPLKVEPLVEEVVRLVKKRVDDERLNWKKDGSVKINVGKIIPNTCSAQTLAGRRKRFRKQLIEKMETLGWYECSVHLYRQRTQ